jgi:hypothetical protein
MRGPLEIKVMKRNKKCRKFQKKVSVIGFFVRQVDPCVYMKKKQRVAHETQIYVGS